MTAIPITQLRQLTLTQLLDLRQRVDALIATAQAREQERAAQAPAAERTSRAAVPKRQQTYKPRQQGGRVIQIERRGEKAYRYERWWEGGTRRSKYLGKAEE
jgi:hypothetical protein